MAIWQSAAQSRNCSGSDPSRPLPGQGSSERPAQGPRPPRRPIRAALLDFVDDGLLAKRSGFWIRDHFNDHVAGRLGGHGTCPGTPGLACRGRREMLC